MNRRWTTVSILCIALLLLVSAASASESQSTADGRTTLRASTEAAGNSVVLAAADAPAAGHPSWIGLVVLIFGGLLGILWLVVGLLSVLGMVEETRGPSMAELLPFPNRWKRDKTRRADGL